MKENILGLDHDSVSFQVNESKRHKLVGNSFLSIVGRGHYGFVVSFFL